MAFQVAYDDAEGEDYFEQLNREAMENAQVRTTRRMQQRRAEGALAAWEQFLQNCRHGHDDRRRHLR